MTTPRGPASLSSSASQDGTRRRLSCPSCAAEFAIELRTDVRTMRCITCRAALSTEGDGSSLGASSSHSASRWAYPLPARQAELELAALATLASLSDAAAPDEAAPTYRQLGRYTLLAELGRGGMGVVYDAWDPELERRIALKVLTGGVHATDTAHTRFLREARAAAALEGPALVRVLDIGVSDGLPYFTMDRVFGPSLQDVLDTSGRLPADEAARILQTVSEGVQAAHDAGIAHRDLKPANLMLDGDGQPRVTDFGLVTSLEGDGGLTATRTILGTPSYMAPEVARGAEDIDWVRSDVYGLGAVLFACLTATPPVPGTSAHAQLAALQQGRIRRTRDVAPDLPVDLAAVVDRALSVDPRDRYPSAREFAEELNRFREGRPVLARPETRLQSLVRRVRPHVPMALGASTVVMLLGAAFAWPYVAAWRDHQAREGAAQAAYEALQPRLATASKEEARRLRLAFANDPDHRNTLAAAKAWIAEGDAQHAEPLLVGNLLRTEGAATEAWARALETTDDPAVGAQVMLRLAEGAWWSDDLATLGARLAQLDEDALPAEDIPRAVDLRLQWALFVGDQDVAVRAWDKARALGSPAGRRYADPRRILPFVATGMPIGPTEALGLVVTPEGTPPQVETLVGDEYIRWAIGDTPTEAGRQPADGLQSRLYTVLPDGTRRSYVDVAADLDGDGEDELYTFNGSRVQRIEPDRTVVPGADSLSPEVERLGSWISGLASTDMDGDGTQELLVAPSEWSAYDLRMLRLGDDGLLHQHARGRHAQVTDMAAVPDPHGPGALLFTAMASWYPSAEVFGPVNPRGPRSGVATWRLQGDELTVVDTWEWPPWFNPAVIEPADLDGDGRDELLASGDILLAQRHATAVFWFDDEGQVEVSIVPGVSLQGGLQADDDPELEFLGRTVNPDTTSPVTRFAWIVGAGDSPLPVFPVEVRPATLQVPPEVAGGTGASAWAAARSLHRAGLPVEAAKVLEREALIRSPDLALAATRAAAGLWREAEVPARAAAALERVARTEVDAAARDAAFADAITAWFDAGQPDEALALAADWRDAGGTPEDALGRRIDAWTDASEHEIRVDPSTSADWLAGTDPLAVAVSRDALDVHLHAGNVAITLPVELEEGAFWMTADFVLSDVDWSGGAKLALRLDDTRMQAEALVSGGGRAYRSTATCLLGQRMTELERPASAGEPTDTTRWRFTLWREAGSTKWSCAGAAPDLDAATQTSFELPGLPSRGEVVIQGRGLDGGHASLRLDRLEVWGATLAADRVAAPPHVLALATDDGLAALRTLPEDDHVARAAAQLLLRRPSLALDELRRADTDDLARRAPVLLRRRPDMWAPVLRDALGDGYVQAYDTAWGLAARSRPHDPRVRQALWADLAGLEPHGDADHPSWRLLASRASLALREGNLEGGTAAAEAWFAAYHQVPAPTGSLRQEAAHLHLALSRTAKAAGDEEVAAFHRAEAIRTSPTPEIMEDRFTRWPGADGSQP